MIIEKTFKCSVQNLDEVTLGIAEEIKNGWHITSINYDPVHITTSLRYYPEFEVTLTRPKEGGKSCI